MQSFFKNNLVYAIAVVAPIVLMVVFVASRSDSEPVAMQQSTLMTEVSVPEGLEVATFGTGCFWCMEAAFQQTPGIESAVSGYAGGTVANPTYEQVYTMSTDHRESVQIFFDPSEISYEEVLDIFWFGIDPTDDGGQFVDRGFAYTTAVFYHDDEQRQIAEQSKLELADSMTFGDEPIVTPIIEFTTFYDAEEYHQDFYLKSPDRYNQYEGGSGREEFREQIWAEIQKEEASQ